jgi:methylthioribulose-1-phosphate dehydratase
MIQSNLTLQEELQHATERELLCELCRRFYTKGWVSGTGGGISIKPSATQALIAPSGVQKEELKPGDLFLVELDQSEAGYKTLFQPQTNKISACTSIFINIYRNRPTAGAVIHSHSLNAVMLTKITAGQQVVLNGYEMLKGLEGGKYFGSHTVPILDNVEHECDLAQAVGKAVIDYPDAHAVLVRDHGFYVWGRTWEGAKIYAECYDYLFGAVVQERTLSALGLIK